MIREYLPGNCYTCKKCLFCFTLEVCKCDKNIKLSCAIQENDLSKEEQSRAETIAALYEKYNLDQKYNCNNVYFKFENAFLEEEITVNAIKDLTDEQMVKLGIVKIRWQKNIKQAA
ncbi:hypothetical protein C1646_772992 [Rhizophagus diaphanus]|nr:hypothetical protein C1646_772992 [Rhizophagus diaphanus] [Rhizophagus sp. MUCL 43196]